jgi:hypothetical protein
MTLESELSKLVKKLVKHSKNPATERVAKTFIVYASKIISEKVKGIERKCPIRKGDYVHFDSGSFYVHLVTEDPALSINKDGDAEWKIKLSGLGWIWFSKQDNECNKMYVISMKDLIYWIDWEKDQAQSELRNGKPKNESVFLPHMLALKKIQTLIKKPRRLRIPVSV